MIRRATSKILWVGRLTVFLVGIAVILALVFGAASTAFASNGDFLKLGSLKNTATKMTVLVSNVADTTRSALQIKNPAGGSALDLQVNGGAPPLKVNPEAGTATNLDADKLDGKDAAAFLPAEIYESSTSQTFSPVSMAGVTVSCDAGDVAVSGSYAVSQASADLNVTSERRVDERFDEETYETNPSGWHVIAENNDASASVTLTVYVNCADRPPLHASGSQ